MENFQFQISNFKFLIAIARACLITLCHSGKQNTSASRILRCLFVSLSLFLLLCVPQNSFAQTATVSASPQTATQSSTLLQKINEIKNQIASKAAEIKQEVTQKIQNKAYIGKISDISGNNISLVVRDETKTINTNEYTAFQLKKGKSLKDLKKDDYIASLGDVDDKGALTAKKIIRFDTPPATPSSIVWGILDQTSSTSASIKTRDNQTLKLLTNSNTVINLSGREIKLNQITSDRKIVVVGRKNQDSINASFVYVVPNAGDILNTKSASPSASAKLTR